MTKEYRDCQGNPLRDGVGPGSIHAVEVTESMGVDLEIYENVDKTNDIGVIKPLRLRINGRECLTPDDCPVVIDGLVDKTKSATATMTVFIRSLKVHGERP